MRASDSGERSNAGRRSVIASTIGASFASALSAIFGIEAWPARPLVLSANRNTPFSATSTP